MKYYCSHGEIPDFRIRSRIFKKVLFFFFKKKTLYCKLMVDNTLSQNKQNALVGRGQSKQSNVQLRPNAQRKQSIMKQGAQNTLRQKANSQIQQGTNSRNNLQQKAKSQIQQGTNSRNNLQQKAKSQIQQGTNSRNNLQQKAKSQIQQGSSENTINAKKAQEIQALSALMNIKEKTTPQKPVPTSGGGSFFLNMLMGVFIAIFAILCVVGYYIWYFLTHPLDDLKGMFHL